MENVYSVKGFNPSTLQVVCLSMHPLTLGLVGLDICQEKQDKIIVARRGWKQECKCRRIMLSMKITN